LVGRWRWSARAAEDTRNVRSNGFRVKLKMRKIQVPSRCLRETISEAAWRLAKPASCCGRTSVQRRELIFRIYPFYARTECEQWNGSFFNKELIMSTIQKFGIKDIKVIGERRPVTEDKKCRIADSMAKIGLRTPISVRKRDNGEIELVAGLHRLEAAKSLGWKEIDCIVMKGGKIQRQLWTIAENLHRSDLTTLQHAEHVAKWKRLVKKLDRDEHVVKPGGRQPKDKGLSRTAKKLGISRETVRRSEAIASISPKAKATAKKAGLDRKQDALLKIAKEGTGGAQVAKVKELAKKEKTKRTSLSPNEGTQLKRLKKFFERAQNFKRAWLTASLVVRRKFVSRIMSLAVGAV
jgi:ParB family chromosome partitioning protein